MMDCICEPGRLNGFCVAHGQLAVVLGYTGFVPESFCLTGRWDGPDEPEPIAPATNPDGLVAVHLDADGNECARWLMSTLKDAEVAAVAGAAEAVGDWSSVVLFDGDSGMPIMRLKTRPLADPR